MNLDKRVLQKIIKEEVASVRSKLRLSERPNRDLISERWQQLAGLNEAAVDAVNALQDLITGKKLTNVEQLKKKIEDYKSRQDDLDAIAGATSGLVTNAKAAGINIEKEELDDFIKQLGGKAGSEADNKKTAVSPGNKGEEKVAKPEEAAAAVKTFKGLIADVRKTIKPEEVSDQELGAIMGALDKISAFKIK